MAPTPSHTTEATPPPAAPGWLHRHDPGLLTIKRSVRSAVVIPAAFGLGFALFPDQQVALFAVFGAFALCLFVDFRGTFRTRLRSYGVLVVVGSALIALGTAVSPYRWVAVATMGVVGFVVLFVGILSPRIAAASTSALLTFVLPVAVVVPPSAIGPRLGGWAIAAALSVPACLVVWPPRWRNDLRRLASAAVGSVARVAEARADGREATTESERMDRDLDALRSTFHATPYPPVSAVGTAVSLTRLVSRVTWAAGNAVLVGDPAAARDPGAIRGLLRASAAALDASARLISDDGYDEDDGAAADQVRRAAEDVDRRVAAELTDELAGLAAPDRIDRPGEPGSDDPLDTSFRARVLGIATEIVTDAALEASGRPPAVGRRVGPVEEPPPRLALGRLTSHLTARSVWFRNSLRAAMGLALAVAVVEVTDVEHGFWVVLGTLSVLRTNALATGATAARALLGTVIGFVAGVAVMVAIGGHTPYLWVVLPFAVFLSGVAPTMISFTAGQAGFTVTVVVVFNILQPTGWKVGLTRIEDVLLGCAASLVVGLLFWPRGATAALRRAVAEAFVANAAYLSDAVAHLTTPGHPVDLDPSHRASDDAYHRLDDAYRQFLSERGTKTVPVEPVAALVTGANRIRLAAFTLGSLPDLAATPADGGVEPVAVAGAVLRDAYASSLHWYGTFAASLDGSGPDPGPPDAHDPTLDDVLRTAYDAARAAGRTDLLRLVIVMAWAAELLDTEHDFEGRLAGTARLFAAPARKGGTGPATRS